MAVKVNYPKCPFSNEVCSYDCICLAKGGGSCVLVDGAIALEKIARNTDRIVEALEEIVVRTSRL